MVDCHIWTMIPFKCCLKWNSCRHNTLMHSGLVYLSAILPVVLMRAQLFLLLGYQEGKVDEKSLMFLQFLCLELITRYLYQINKKIPRFFRYSWVRSVILWSPILQFFTSQDLNFAQLRGWGVAIVTCELAFSWYSLVNRSFEERCPNVQCHEKSFTYLLLHWSQITKLSCA